MTETPLFLSEAKADVAEAFLWYEDMIEREPVLSLP